MFYFDGIYLLFNSLNLRIASLFSLFWHWSLRTFYRVGIMWKLIKIIIGHELFFYRYYPMIFGRVSYGFNLSSWIHCVCIIYFGGGNVNRCMPQIQSSGGTVSVVNTTNPVPIEGAAIGSSLFSQFLFFSFSVNIYPIINSTSTSSWHRIHSSRFALQICSLHLDADCIYSDEKCRYPELNQRKDKRTKQRDSEANPSL